jgi:hypothetical protein
MTHISVLATIKEVKVQQKTARPWKIKDFGK